MYTLPELRKISRELRTLASRAAQSPHEHARANIKRLVNFVDSTPILRREVNRVPGPEGDPLEILSHCRNEGKRIPIQEEEDAEFGFKHALLTALAEDNKEEFWKRCYKYGHTRGVQEWASELLHDVINPYVGYLEKIIANLIIDLTEKQGDRRSIDIKIHAPSQINIAEDQGSISAQQSIGPEVSEIIAAARDLITTIQSTQQLADDENLEEIYAIASQSITELQQGQPNRGRLSKIRDKLRRIGSGVEMSTKIATQLFRLAELLDRFLE